MSSLTPPMISQRESMGHNVSNFIRYKRCMCWLGGYKRAVALGLDCSVALGLAFLLHAHYSHQSAPNMSNTFVLRLLILIGMIEWRFISYTSRNLILVQYRVVRCLTPIFVPRFSLTPYSLLRSKPDYQLYPSSVYDAYRKVMSLAREYAMKRAFFFLLPRTNTPWLFPRLSMNTHINSPEIVVIGYNNIQKAAVIEAFLGHVLVESKDILARHRFAFYWPTREPFLI